MHRLLKLRRDYFLEGQPVQHLISEIGPREVGYLPKVKQLVKPANGQVSLGVFYLVHVHLPDLNLWPIGLSQTHYMSTHCSAFHSSQASVAFHNLYINFKKIKHLKFGLFLELIHREREDHRDLPQDLILYNFKLREGR